MGTGFNVDDTEDPVAILELLNEFAVAEVSEGLIERPVGNMGILSVEHPKALEFAASKTQSATTDWKFNISLNITREFITAYQRQEPYLSAYGHEIDPQTYLLEIAKHASQTGDPGVVFMHRYENDNKTPQLGQYVSVAPCSEVALLNGEVCHFAYLNLVEFLNNRSQIDYSQLRESIQIATLILDNAIELTIKNSPTPETAWVIKQIRKIGVGVCGFSDLLSAMGVPYHSLEASLIAEDLISFINYESKCASVDLAIQRGPFPAFTDSQTKKDLIISQFANKTTRTVTVHQWEQLNLAILKYGIRNIATLILPPTGRSALLAGVSTSIEPHFRLLLNPSFEKSFIYQCQQANYQGDIKAQLNIIKNTGSCRATDVPECVKQVFLTCLELTPEAHLAITTACMKFTDESISKTINLPNETPSEEVARIYMQAYEAGLKGISVYVNGCRKSQPKKLMEEEKRVRLV